MLRTGIGRQAVVAGACLFALALAGPVAAQTSPRSADLPPCGPVTEAVSDCVLPTWPQDAAASLPSLFGDIDPDAGVWVADAVGDVPPDALDILAVGVTPIRLDGAARLRSSDAVLKLGKAKKALKDGPALLVRTVVDRAPDAITSGHGGIFVATDIDGVRSNNAPSGVDTPDGPFSDLQDVYSLNVLAGSDRISLLDTDLAKSWYKDKDAFAASRPAPEVVDMLVRPEQFGDVLNVVTYVDGEMGGYDAVGIGPTLAPIPIDGRVGRLPLCVEGSIVTEPFRVRRLVENGQAFRGIKTPQSWLGGATFTLTAAERAALETLIAGADDDADGAIEVPASAVLIDEGLNVRQSPTLALRVDGDTAYLGLQVGLARKGYHVVREVQAQTTGDAVVDDFLARATTALVAAIPPFRSAKKAGPVLGGGAGSCLSPSTAATG